MLKEQEQLMRELTNKMTEAVAPSGRLDDSQKPSIARRQQCRLIRV